MSKSIYYNRETADRMRWVENVSDGLRLVGFADELDRSIRHEGWYCTEDNWSGEVARGIVYALPAAHGEQRLVPGVADPCNPDCAYLDFRWVCDDQTEAARAADECARIYGEREMEYSRARDAGRRVDDIAEEIADIRRDSLALLKERRRARQFDSDAFPALCATIRATIARNLDSIAELRNERDSLVSDFGDQPGFVE